MDHIWGPYVGMADSHLQFLHLLPVLLGGEWSRWIAFCTVEVFLGFMGNRIF